jgi:hypothetical protein
MEKNHQTEPASNDLVIAHMTTIQGLITRFPGNSASCKNMCLALVAVQLSKDSAVKIQQGTFIDNDLYKLVIGGRGRGDIGRAFLTLKSHSIWPFYGVLFVCLFVIQYYFSSFAK